MALDLTVPPDDPALFIEEMRRVHLPNVHDALLHMYEAAVTSGKVTDMAKYVEVSHKWTAPKEKQDEYANLPKIAININTNAGTFSAQVIEEAGHSDFIDMELTTQLLPSELPVEVLENLPQLKTVDLRSLLD